MKAFLALFALIAAVASAAGYLSGSKVESMVSGAYSNEILNNPFNIFKVLAVMPMAWLACFWESIFGGAYTKCVGTWVVYILA